MSLRTAINLEQEALDKSLRFNLRPEERPRIVARLARLREEQAAMTRAHTEADQRFNARFHPPVQPREWETWSELRCRNCDTLLDARHPTYNADSRYCAACGHTGEDWR